jgi:5,10-methylenetetrahydromethanopterin reductase
MRFCVNYVPMLPLRDNIEWWQACERAGIERIGFGDTPALGREVYVTLAACALTTERIQIMPSVSNPVSRDPSVTAAAVYALSELAPDRVAALGLGTGDSALWGTGLKRASVEGLREYILAVRGLLSGRDVEYAGRRFRAEWAQSGGGAQIPIYVACAGPRVLRMAAQVADGLIVAMGFAPENIAFVRRTIAEACAEAGRRVDELSLWWSASVHFAPSQEAALDAGVNLAAAWLTAGGLDGKQIPEEFRAPLREFTRDAHDLSFMYRTPNRNQILSDRARDLGIYDWLLARTPRLWGTPADVTRRLRELSSQGLTDWVVNLSGVGIDRIGTIDALATEVIPAV